eukprot:192647_1
MDGPEIEITQADESRYLEETIDERKRDIKQQDTSTKDDSLFIKWKNIEGAIPTFSDDVLSVMRGFRNGFIYGIRIRLPHAFVMTLLFNRGPIDKMSSMIFKKTKEHSIHLGRFVT